MKKADLNYYLSRSTCFLVIKEDTFLVASQNYVLRIATTEYKTHRGYWRTRKVFKGTLAECVEEAQRIRRGKPCQIESWTVGEETFFSRYAAYQAAEAIKPGEAWSVVNEYTMPIERYLDMQDVTLLSLGIQPSIVTDILQEKGLSPVNIAKLWDAVEESLKNEG